MRHYIGARASQSASILRFFAGLSVAVAIGLVLGRWLVQAKPGPQGTAGLPFQGTIVYRVSAKAPGFQRPYDQALPDTRTLYVRWPMLHTVNGPLSQGGLQDMWTNLDTGETWFRFQDSSFIVRKKVNAWGPDAFLPDLSSYEQGPGPKLLGYATVLYEAVFEAEGLDDEVQLKLWLAPALCPVLPQADSLPPDAGTDLLLATGRLGLPLKRELFLKQLNLTYTETASEVEVREVPDSLVELPQLPVRDFRGDRLPLRLDAPMGE